MILKEGELEMINVEAMTEITRLCSLYQQHWNKEVDYVGMPKNIDEERLVLVLRRIVDSGESVMCGYAKIRDGLKEYHNYLETITEIADKSILDKPCPICGKSVRYYKCGSSYEFKYEAPLCLSYIYRGI